MKPPDGRAAVPRAAEPALPRRRLAALRDRRRRSAPRIAWLVVVVQDAPTRYAGLALARGRVRLLRRSTGAGSARAAARDRARADRCSARRSRSSTATSSCPLVAGPRVARRRSTSPARLAAERRRDDRRARASSRCRSTCRSTRSCRRQEDAGRPSCSTRRATLGELYGVRRDRAARPRSRSAGRAIVDEAERRQQRDRRPRRAARRQRGAPIFGDTADYVLKHAPCRVMVARRPRRRGMKRAARERRPPSLARRVRSAIGFALLIVTALHGGGIVGFVLGALFVARGLRTALPSDGACAWPASSPASSARLDAHDALLASPTARSPRSIYFALGDHRAARARAHAARPARRRAALPRRRALVRRGHDRAAARRAARRRSSGARSTTSPASSTGLGAVPRLPDRHCPRGFLSTDDEGAPRGAGMHQGRLLVRALDVLGAGRSRQRLGKVVTLEDQYAEEVGVDLGERLVGDLDAQEGARLQTVTNLRSQLGNSPEALGLGADERRRCRRRSSSPPPGLPSGRWAAGSPPSMPPTWGGPRSPRRSTAPM